MVKTDDVMRFCRNHFVTGYEKGAWQTLNGVLLTEGLEAGARIALEGSRWNDGVYMADEKGQVTGLRDEKWTGIMWHLSPPGAFLALCEEIRQYDEQNPVTEMTGEAFGEYRYTAEKKGGWQQAFAQRLLPWRRMIAEVKG